MQVEDIVHKCTSDFTKQNCHVYTESYKKTMYDQEMPQSQNTDQPMAPQGRDNRIQTHKCIQIKVSKRKATHSLLLSRSCQDVVDKPFPLYQGFPSLIICFSSLLDEVLSCDLSCWWNVEYKLTHSLSS